MFKRINAWLTQSYTCRFCDGSGYETNRRMLRNQVRSWSVVVLAVILVTANFWIAKGPARPPLGRPAAPGPR